jgi:hypothetical protein
MPRTEISEVAQTVTSIGLIKALAGATVLVVERGTDSEVDVFAAASGSATVENPLTADGAGRIDGWLEPGLYDLVVSHTRYETIRQPVFAPAESPAAPIYFSETQPEADGPWMWFVISEGVVVDIVLEGPGA